MFHYKHTQMKVKTSIAIDDQTFRAIKIEAAIQRRSFSHLMGLALEAGMDRIQTKAGKKAASDAMKEGAK
jgi:hypothetical protein